MFDLNINGDDKGFQTSVASPATTSGTASSNTSSSSTCGEGGSSNKDGTSKEPLLKETQQQDQQQEQQEQQQNDEKVTEEDNGPSLLLVGAAESDALFIKATKITFVSWLALLGAVCLVAPEDSWERLEGVEQTAAATAFCCLVLCLVLVMVVPLGIIPTSGAGDSNPKAKFQISGVLVAAITVQLVAMATNFMLAWLPTVVMVDPITGARVFLFRLVEWTPLAGLMTFLAEAVDLPQRSNKKSGHIWTALFQSLSCFCGLVFPFCYGKVSWTICMIASFGIYLTIFPRVTLRRNRLKSFQPRGNNLADKEVVDRLHFAYFLILTCAGFWSVLVILYFVSWGLHWVSYETMPGLAMLCDTFFDVIAKGAYMKLIVDVHRLVYDPAARTRRQLQELCRLVSVLWDCASDVIVISVKVGDKTTSMLSPAFAELMSRKSKDQNTKRLALVVESDDSTSSVNGKFRSEKDRTDLANSYFVNPDDILAGNFSSVPQEFENNVPQNSLDAKVPQSKAQKQLILQGRKLSQATREFAFLGNAGFHPETKPQGAQQGLMDCILDGEKGKVHCEISASMHGGGAVIGVVRDSTERHRRRQAERKALEAMVRQKEAQSINSFTRHEVKNGLLGSIEMVEGIKRILADASKTHAVKEESQAKIVKDLGEHLHQTLDTVLAETMARDVIYKEYLPRLEGCQIADLLKVESDESGRFSIKLSPATMPRLHLDPQLIRYIHRNAVSNATKYGKFEGKVLTQVSYSARDGNLTIEVSNEPGLGHSELVELGEEASDGVFKQGKRLHTELNDHQDTTATSNGDGAWIMQKCAMALNGDCTIRFEPTSTVFAAIFPVDLVSSEQQCATEQFELPSDAWGIAVDDSKIQRKLMGRILLNAGLQEKRIIVLGKDPEESTSLTSYLATIFAEDDNAKILVLMDENLDYKDAEGKSLMLSGSTLAQDALKGLSSAREKQVLVLVRSANDSVTDVELYKRRTHGFFPKAPMQKGRIREILAPLWHSRFKRKPRRTSSITICAETAASAILDALPGLLPEVLPTIAD